MPAAGDNNLGLNNLGRLVGLVEFLAGKSKQPISKKSLLILAQRLGINLTSSNLSAALQQEPLVNLFEPEDPQSDVLVYKGEEQAPAGMPVDQAQQVVAKMAKRANPLS
jgi:hypothetical protein